MNNYSIIKAIRRSSSQYHFPDSLLGFGIPDLVLADILITASNPSGNLVHIFPNPSSGLINLWLPDTGEQGNQYDIYDISGRKTQTGIIQTHQQNQAQISVELLSAGTYIIIIQTENNRLTGVFTRL